MSEACKVLNEQLAVMKELHISMGIHKPNPLDTRMNGSEMNTQTWLVAEQSFG